MRARPLLIVTLVLALAALSGCGGGDKNNGTGSSGSSADGKQSKVSADAYPTIKKFAASNIALENYGPVCDELAGFKDDKVAQVSEKTCRNLVTLTKSLEKFKTAGAKCKNLNCVADKTEPIISNYLTSFGDVLRAHNSALAGVLKPSPCLTGLQTSQADLDKLDASLKRLPAAIKAFRGGDRTALSGLFKGNFGTPDPAPCKP
jgi:hypothetical protein